MVPRAKGQTLREADHRRDKMGIDCERALEKTDGGVIGCFGVRAIALHPPAHGKIDRVRIVRSFAHRAQSLSLHEFHAQRVCQPRNELNLQLTELTPVALETVGPDMRACFGRDQLGVQGDAFADAAHAAFENVAHAEVAPDLFRVDVLCPCR